jgi:hypothetical protein
MLSRIFITLANVRNTADHGTEQIVFSTKREHAFSMSMRMKTRCHAYPRAGITETIAPMHRTVRAEMEERDRLECAMDVSVHQDITAQVFVAIRVGKRPRERNAMAVQWITSRLPVELQLMISSMVAAGITQQCLDTTTPRLAVVLEGTKAKYIRDGRACIPSLSGAIVPCRPQHMRGPSDATIRYYERAVRSIPP